jgi:hypothetical protein
MTGVLVADPAEWVRAAARRTLGSGSARVWHGGCSVPGPPHGRSLTPVYQGVADLARRRLCASVEFGAGWDHLSDLLLERFPWLDDEVEDDGEDPEGFVVYAGTARFFGHDGNWFQAADGDATAARRSPNDPLWIVEAMAVVDAASPPRPSRELMRGTSCQRAAFIIDPRTHTTEFEPPPPYPLLGRVADAAAGLSHRLTGEVWISEEGRIDRVHGRASSRGARAGRSKHRSTGCGKRPSYGTSASPSTSSSPIPAPRRRSGSVKSSRASERSGDASEPTSGGGQPDELRACRPLARASSPTARAKAAGVKRGRARHEGAHLLEARPVAAHRRGHWSSRRGPLDRQTMATGFAAVRRGRAGARARSQRLVGSAHLRPQQTSDAGVRWE